MANDKDFLLKNAVEVGGPTKVTLGTVTSNNIDLATGNYFADTPSGASTYTISNAGDVQSFQLEVTGGTEEVAQNFSTTLYTGNGSTQTITNGIDLDGEGGLVWIKERNNVSDHGLFDTERGKDYRLRSNTTNSQTLNSGWVTSFNSNGFGVGSSNSSSGSDYASWTFRKAPNFFTCLTYSGTGATGHTINHDLGCEVGTLIIKRTDAVNNWYVHHRSVGGTQHLILDQSGAATSYGGTELTTSSTNFTLNMANNITNASGGTYVAYLFAHDDAADGLIQCGSFTTDGSSDASVTLGWEPQWILYKGTAGGSWSLYDSVRGLDTGSGQLLLANSSLAEISGTGGIPTSSTGFTVNTGETNSTYIYIAIRAASDLDLTWPSSIEWAGGVAPSAPATGETDVFTLSTDDGGTSYVGVKTADNLS